MFMNRRFLLFVAWVPVLACAQTSQKGFVHDIQKSVAGWGKLVVNQDARLTKLVDNDTVVAPVARKEGKNTDTVKSNVSSADTGEGEVRADVKTPHAVKLKRYKISGYRVQIYAGNNSRNSRMEAEKTAQRFKGYFPKVPVYTHFYPPRWVCRVGDFRTSEQAQAFMQQVRQLKVFSGLIVVKSAIQVVYRSESEE